MTMSWDGYVALGLGAVDLRRELPRAEARRVFTGYMQTKRARIEMLASLLAASGVTLGADDAGIQSLNDWFFASVEADQDRAGSLRPRWYSVCHDIALFLGDVMIQRHPNLRWEFFTWGKSNVAFQRHVVMGFKTEDPKFHTSFDVERAVLAYAHRIVESRGSVATYGVVGVRGARVDVDAAVQHHHKEVDTDEFSSWFFVAARRNGAIP